MKIGPFTVGEQPIKIAEIGLNHGGSLDRALEMIGVAKECGADVAKFQTFKASEFCHPDDPLYPVFKSCELPDDAWEILSDECKHQGILFMSTPQNPSDLELILPYISAIKVGSDDGANVPLLKEYASHGLPMVVSLGMNIDIDATIAALAGHPTILLVCTSQYPCPDSEARVSRIASVRQSRILQSQQFRYDAGFSDHTIGNEAAVMAVAYGATVFEKHFTLDKTLEGPDHAWACNPDELKSWCHAIDRAWVLKGDSSLDLTDKEEAQRVKYQRKSGARLRGEHGAKAI